MIAILPLVVAVLGALVYALATNAKAAELGRIAFACGLLVALLAFGATHWAVRL